MSLRERARAAWEQAQEEAEQRLRAHVETAAGLLEEALWQEGIDATVVRKRDRAAAVVDDIRFEWGADTFSAATRPAVVILCPDCGAELFWACTTPSGEVRLLETAGAALLGAKANLRKHACLGRAKR
jgi:hypothetical protein